MNGKTMDYVTFGKGKQPLVIIPGLGDGLQTVKGMAMPFSITYRILAKRYKIYVFSRINELRQGYTTRDMAADVAEAMETLNLDTAYFMGISQGGMIAQWLVADFRFLSNIMGRLGRIKDEKRIAIQSQSCLTHDSLEVLKEIQCPTLVLGALEDDVIGVDGSKELAKAISSCQLLILKHSGHALYEENKAFQEAVCEFLN